MVFFKKAIRPTNIIINGRRQTYQYKKFIPKIATIVEEEPADISVGDEVPSPSEPTMTHSETPDEPEESITFHDLVPVLDSEDVVAPPEAPPVPPPSMPTIPPQQQLRRSLRIAANAPPILPLLRRSPRLALKPRVSYVGMC